MPRSTALIRDVLVHWFMLRWIEQEMPLLQRSSLGQICITMVLEPLHKVILRQINLSKRQLKQAGTHVLSQHISEKCIAIEYRENKQMYHANYPIPILFADAKAGLRQRLQEVCQL